MKLTAVIDFSEHHNGDGEDSNEPYSYQGTSSANFNGVEVYENKPPQYRFGTHDSRIEADCKLGDDVFVVYAKYSTGDTFGSSEAFEVMDVFTDYAEAEAVAGALRNVGKKSYRETFNCYGKNYEYRIPWYGYFEHLIHVDVAKTWVRKGK